MVENRSAYYLQLKEQFESIEKKSEIVEPVLVVDNVKRINNHFCKFPIPDEKDPEEEIENVLEEYKQFHRLLIKIKQQINRKNEKANIPKSI